MKKSILDFPAQFSWEPSVMGVVESGFERVAVCAMGGSALAAEILTRFSDVEVVVHRDYRLPVLDGRRKTLYIFCSYSGNSEEVLSGFDLASRQGKQMAVITTGGVLLERARKVEAPYVVVPATGIQPRMATGFIFKALAVLTGQRAELLRWIAELQSMDAAGLEERGKALASALTDKIPVFYASEQNSAMAHIAKIKFNETGKIPAFYNTVPELNHNEMNGLDTAERARQLTAQFVFVLITDTLDQTRVQTRMEVLKEMLSARSLPVYALAAEGEGVLERVFSVLLVCDWAAYHTALLYGADPQEVPMVEEFKKRIK